MASGNRVEELEQRVQELEATVDGLTDELVECKVRIRELENVVDGEVGLDAVTNRDVDGPERQRAEPNTESEPTDETAEEAAADTTKSAAPEGDDEAESGESEIIIA